MIVFLPNHCLLLSKDYCYINDTIYCYEFCNYNEIKIFLSKLPIDSYYFKIKHKLKIC